ncbi:MAG: copper homeostasis protein CutC [Flavobacteriales bacterium]|nr:copper homeostasis protein CutC [Flavobacteriales bacterium]
MPVLVEVCVTSMEEAVAAEACGADGVELCSWLACGGITPSSGLVDAVRGAVRIPVRVLVRPTPGGFVYNDAEVHALLTDAEILGGGAIGLVSGGLLADGSASMELMHAVKQVAPESEITFHRAIDHALDPMAVLAECMGAGIDRILTSGGSTLAMDGAGLISQLVKRAGDRFIVAAAGGINAGNVVELIERTGVPEIHFAAQRPKSVPVHAVAMSSANQGMRFDVEPDRDKIEGVMNALAKAGLR